MANKMARIPIDPDQHRELEKLLGEVPQKTVIQYDWTSPAGRDFIKRVREIQVTGSVPLPWIAEALEVSRAALNGAIGYWERQSPSRSNNAARRRREKRTLSPRKGATSTEAEE